MDARELERRIRKLESTLRVSRGRQEQDFYEAFQIGSSAPTSGELSGGSIYFVPLMLHDVMQLRRITMLCYTGAPASAERGVRLGIFKPESLSVLARQQSDLIDGRPALRFVRSLGNINTTAASIEVQDLSLQQDQEIDPEERLFLAVWPTSNSNFFSATGYQNAAYVATWGGGDWPEDPITPNRSASSPYVLLRSALGVRLYGPVL